MWMIATEDLTEFLPLSPTRAQRTQVDVCMSGIPRLFGNKNSAALALGHWLNGPYIGICEEDGWYYDAQTDPNRRLIWEGKLAPREVKVIAS